MSKADDDTVSRVETYGCEVVSVKATGAGLGWSYTVGVFDTSGEPEIITVGLSPNTANGLLNRAAAALRKGVRLDVGRHKELVGKVECEFRPVDPKWVRHLMDSALWYYSGDDFSVLQAVYPDTENRFPGEPDFDTSFEQPLLQRDAPMTRLEKDFWAAADPNSSLFDWKFPDPPHMSAYLSEAVNAGREAVTYVSHDREDGAWQFLGDSMAGDGDGVLNCLHHPIDKDPSLKELSDLPIGWWAEREKPGDPWIRKEHAIEDED